MRSTPLALPERIAFAGDWHANLAWARNALWEAHDKRADVVVHTGDFGYDMRRRFLDGLSEACAVTRIPIMFVDGNHEDHQWLARQPLDDSGLRPLTDWIWHIPRGFRWEWAGIRLVGLGGAHSVDGLYRRQGGQLWQREERITDEQATAVADGGRADVLVSHDCPAGVDIPDLDPTGFPPVEILRAQEHRQILRDVVDAVRPAAIWHGHYHRSHVQTVDLGYGPVAVRSLDMDSTSLAGNLHVIDLEEVAAVVGRRPS